MKPFNLLGKTCPKILETHFNHHSDHAWLGWGTAFDPWIIRLLIDRLTTQPLNQGTIDFISRISAIALLVFIARAFMQFIRSYAAHKAGWGVVSDARRLVYEHIQKLSLRFYEDKQLVS